MLAGVSWEEGQARPDDATRLRARRVWLMSPALATVVFFAAQIAIQALVSSPGRRLTAASAETPSTTPVKVRVVTQIRSLDDRARSLAHVPKSEAALLELFKKQGCVVFSPQEVETIGTQEVRFPDQKLRPARSVR